MINFEENISLEPLHTFGARVTARYFYDITNIADLPKAIKKAKELSLPFLILGGGSNLLFKKDFEGLVLKISFSGIKVLEESSEQVVVEVAAGENWHSFVLYCIEKNWGGIENLSLIPGTVGACPVQNIGAYGVEVKDVIMEVEVYDLEQDILKRLDLSELKFGYRDSVFKHELKGKVVITKVVFKLSKDAHKLNTSYGVIEEVLEENCPDRSLWTIKQVSDAVIDIRSSKLPDPAIIGNCGSFFKNPVVTTDDFERLKKEFPDLVYYEVPNGYKIPAGWLIDQTGLKGITKGNVGTYEKQALVLVNKGGATGTEAYAFAEYVIEEVSKKFGITLSPEVNIL